MTNSKLIPVFVKGLALDPEDAPVVLLQEVDGGRVLPIWIGVFEAASIQIALDGVCVERPLTHDLLVEIAEALGARIDTVSIVDLAEDTYYARVTIVEEAGEPNSQVLHARPSDALALALRCDAQILVAESVMERYQSSSARESQVWRQEARRDRSDAVG